MFFKPKASIKTQAALATALCVAAGVATAEVVVVISAKSGVDKLTPEQVSQIFLAKKPVTLPSGEEARPVDLYEGTPLRDEFYSKVIGKDAAQVKAYWSNLLFSGLAKERPKAYADSALVKKVVAGTPGQIGYISKSDVDGSVKVVLTP